jgi:hypothetical protein
MIGGLKMEDMLAVSLYNIIFAKSSKSQINGLDGCCPTAVITEIRTNPPRVIFYEKK